MKRILVAVDGSEHSEKALDLASDLASRYQAELVLLHVLSDRPLSDAERHLAEVEYLDEVVGAVESAGMLGTQGDPRVTAQRALAAAGAVAGRLRAAMADRLLDQARARASGHGVRTIRCLVEEGDPARAILRVAAELAVDMIVMGSRGLGDAKGLLMGSVSHKVAHLAPCTCVSVT